MKDARQGEGRPPRFPSRAGSGRRCCCRPPATLATGAHADSETNDEKRKSRYRETEHVKTFYRVNRYPTKG